MLRFAFVLQVAVAAEVDEVFVSRTLSVEATGRVQKAEDMVRTAQPRRSWTDLGASIDSAVSNVAVPTGDQKQTVSTSSSTVGHAQTSVSANVGHAKTAGTATVGHATTSGSTASGPSKTAGHSKTSSSSGSSECMDGTTVIILTPNNGCTLSDEFPHVMQQLLDDHEECRTTFCSNCHDENGKPNATCMGNMACEIQSQLSQDDISTASSTSITSWSSCLANLDSKKCTMTIPTTDTDEAASPTKSSGTKKQGNSGKKIRKSSGKGNMKAKRNSQRRGKKRRNSKKGSLQERVEARADARQKRADKDLDDSLEAKSCE